MIVASSNLQFDSNDHNEKFAFGIEIKPTKNINLTEEGGDGEGDKESD